MNQRQRHVLLDFPGWVCFRRLGLPFCHLEFSSAESFFLGGQLKLATAFFIFIFCTPNYLVDSFLNYLVGFPSQHEQSIVSPFVSIKHLVGFLSLPENIPWISLPLTITLCVTVDFTVESRKVSVDSLLVAHSELRGEFSTESRSSTDQELLLSNCLSAISR